ncbi:hypothetical protein FRB94_000463 [Tulasnella sp. JGI-2019a]|nr:hypothetical protein FRB94_000463 [Tulasnella sp. JGI-2019a]KAG9010356.1 hypothetical protein FRB93_004195 [Tulasnella sp. JGI-2019a]
MDVVLSTGVLLTPINFVLTHVKPPYGPFQPLDPHPHFALAVCLTAGTTLFLFFAGGFWAEKIGYANKYVSHANKTLRSFNMYLNVRPRPISSMWIMRVLRSSTRNGNNDIASPPLTPITTTSSRRRTRDNFTSYSPPATPTTASAPTIEKDSGSLNLTDQDSIVTRAPPTPLVIRPQRTGGGGVGAQITPIPPPTNPRGELIFNSRVDKTFRESYERYRTAYERAKEEWDRKTYEERVRKAWWSWFLMRRSGSGSNIIPSTPSRIAKGSEGVSPSTGMASSSPTSMTPPASRRGRPARTSSRSSTPSSSRKPSPAGSASASSTRRRSALVDALESVPERLPLDVDSILARRRTPVPDEESDTSSVITLSQDSAQHSLSHKRKESFSFLLGRPGGLTDE